MFEQVSAVLEQSIGELQIPLDAAALTRSFELLDRFTAKVTAAVGEYDEAEGWRDSGATSMTAWLRHKTGRSGRDASRIARAARRLAGLPVTAAAYADGRLSGGQVQAIVANLNDETVSLFADNEHEMVATIAGLGVRDAARVMQAWASAAKDHLQPDPTDDEPGPVGPERSLHLSQTMDGRGELSASLDPEARALTETALRLADSPDTEAEPERTPARRRADAFVDILRFFLDHQTTHVGGRHRPHLNVLVDYEDLTGNRPRPHTTGPFDGSDPAGPRAGNANHNHDNEPFGWGYDSGQSATRSGRGRGGRLLDGTVLDAATLHRLACDAGVHRMIMAGRSSILDYGHTTRTIPANLWAALIARDQHCRFPGCDRPPQWCEAHHIVAWEHGGPTSIINLGLYCTRHHHILHTPGWHATMEPNGTIHLTDPQGHIHTTHPPGQLPNLFHPPP